MKKSEITAMLSKAFSQFETLENLSDKQLYASQNGKWTIAENIEHLTLSIKPVNLALSLPTFVLLFFGKTNRSLMTYEEVVAFYKSKLNAGVKATKEYIPAKQRSKENVLNDFRKKHATLISKLENCNEQDLDKYFLPHPILGKLSLREILFFTIYHINHHFKAIQH